MFPQKDMGILIFILGLIFGSFLNVCIYRIPKKESIVFPPSHCTTCEHTLFLLDLVPVVSYIFSKGRCRYCKDKVSIKYPIVELMTAFLFVLLFSKFISNAEPVQFWAFIFYSFLTCILIIATFIDLKLRIIPNGLVLTGIITGVMFAVLAAIFNIEYLSSNKLLDALFGFLIGGGTLFLVAFIAVLLTRKEVMGGGDIKLMAMIGLFLGWRFTLVALLLSIYAGGIIGAILLITRIKKRGDFIPYGPFIALGTILAILYAKEIMTVIAPYFSLL